MTQYLWQSFGDVASPTKAGDVTDGHLFSVGDPARDRLIGLFTQAIKSELGEAWAVAASGTVLDGTDPVADTLYEQPRKSVLREGGYSFPLLAVYRAGEAEHGWKTLEIRQQVQTWGCDYILGPLKAEDYRRLGGALAWVAKVIDSTIESRGHPDYESGALQFFPGVGGLAELSVARSQEGLAEFGDQGEGLELYALSLELRSVEHDSHDEDAFADFVGARHTVGVGGGEGVLPDGIVADTEFGPDE